ncbi:MAG: HAD-IA family hydrolase [Marinilabiliaceae bacterium]|nr:HAD-IA family hydrolase [Marinilabiliaceae bacterium]
MNVKTKYEHLFFDLDNTIWDFTANYNEALKDIYIKYNLKSLYSIFDSFKHKLKQYNYSLSFFLDTILPKKLSTQIINDFEEILSKKIALIHGTEKTLSYLQQKYTLHIITNGTAPHQKQKIENTNLNKYFKTIYISDEIGVKKPQKAFFEYVIKSSNAKKNKSLIIGDSWNSDILGAKSFGLEAIYINKKNKAIKSDAIIQISDITQLCLIL